MPRSANNKTSTGKQNQSASLTIALSFLLSLAVALTTVLTSLPATAQTSAVPATENNPAAAGDQWYQIEMIVFTNHTPGNDSLEVWSTNPDLGYPDTLTFLDAIKPDSKPEHTSEAVNNLNTNGTGITTGSTASSELPAAESPFIRLTKDQRTQNVLADRLRQSRYFKTVFHEAWRQPLPSRDKPTHIPIVSGRQFDDHFELEGYISLSKDRFLHFDSHLWLNGFERYARRYLDQQPVAPVPATTPFPAGDQFGNSPESIAADEQPDEQISILPPVPQPPDLTMQDELAAIDEAINEEEFYNEASSQGTSSSSQDIEAEQANTRQYRLTRTVVLQEHRTMQLQKMHYFDHPLLGVLVIITRYELPKLQASELPASTPAAKSLEKLPPTGR